MGISRQQAQIYSRHKEAWFRKTRDNYEEVWSQAVSNLPETLLESCLDVGYWNISLFQAVQEDANGQGPYESCVSASYQLLSYWEDRGWIQPTAAARAVIVRGLSELDDSLPPWQRGHTGLLHPLRSHGCSACLSKSDNPSWLLRERQRGQNTQIDVEHRDLQVHDQKSNYYPDRDSLVRHCIETGSAFDKRHPA